MGQSTNGIICYGVDLGEELPWVANSETWGKLEEHGFDEGDNDDEIMAHLLGGLPIFKSEHESGSDAWGEELSEYWEKRDHILEESGIKLVRHCSGDYPMYILAATGTVMSASRGDPKAFNPAKMAADLEMTRGDQKLRAALAKLEVKDQEPSWLLCSMWS